MTRCRATCVLPPLDASGDGTTGTQRNGRIQGYSGCAERHEANPLRQRRQDELSLEQCEMVAQADAGTIPKGNVGHAGQRLLLARREAVGVEPLRIREVFGTAM